MNILDIAIIIFILFGALVGFKRGFTRELVEAVGFILVVVLAYVLKNPLSVFLYEHFPFFKIGILKGIEILNILVYEMLAFIICLIILHIILKIIIKFTAIFEKILTATIILGIPSKMAGAVVGIIHYFVFVFIGLYVLSLACFNVEFINESKLREKIVNNTPVLSGFADKSEKVISEFIDLKHDYEDKTISEYDFNYKAIELFLKYDVITTESLNKLFEKGKIEKFDNYADLLDYKEENNGNN